MMIKVRKLTLLILVFMFIASSVIQFGSTPNATNIGLTKNFTESYEHHDAIWIQSDQEFADQATAESWPGNGSKETPYIISGYLFDCETQPLRIWHTTVHWIFTGNEIFGVGGNIQCGTWVENVTNGAIIANEVHNRHSGLAIAEVSDFVITDNYVHDCWGNGIELFGAMNNTIIENNVVENIGAVGIYSVSARDCIVKDNMVSYCENIGIALLTIASNCTVTGNIISYCESSGIMMAQVPGSTISDNTISHVAYQGIYLTRPIDCVVSGNIIGDIEGLGIGVTNSEFTEIFENTIENCTEEGMLLKSGINTTVEWNSVYNITGYAVHLETQISHFSVMYNTFIENGVTCQVCDDGTSNLISHNYYDDWNSPDADGNGYVDLPYIISGDSENQDDFPLAVAGVIPTSEGNSNSTPLPMEIILIAGAIGAIVIVAGILIIKRR
jgi:parallel beta-helix repeat protein